MYVCIYVYIHITLYLYMYIILMLYPLSVLGDPCSCDPRRPLSFNGADGSRTGRHRLTANRSIFPSLSCQLPPPST